MLALALSDYRNRISGGWTGKLIGLAAGRRTDGVKQPDTISEDWGTLARAEAFTSDGLDFPVIWLRALEGAGPKITDDDLIGACLRYTSHGAQAWCYARANFQRGFAPPLSGVFDNPFREADGALARADLWGMLTPGDPEQAAWFARRDAMLDHAGTGLEAASWLAALVSAAFVERGTTRLLELALGLLPADSQVARVVRDVMRWHGEHASWTRTRELLLRLHGRELLSDAIVSTGLITLALLQARGDLARGVLTAANCGWSAACTSGAVGAVLGVMVGETGALARWAGPLRPEITLSPRVAGLPSRISITEITGKTAELGRMIVRSECAGRVELVDLAPEEEQLLPAPESASFLRQLAIGPYVSTYRRGPLRLQLDHSPSPTIAYDRPCRLTIALTNTTNRTREARCRLAAPMGFVVAAATDPIPLTEGTTVSFMVTVTAPRTAAHVATSNPCTLFIALEDGAEYTVPLTLAGESVWYAAGPFDAFEGTYWPEEAGLLTSASLAGDGWRPLTIAEPSVGLLQELTGEPGTYYLATDLHSPEDMRAHLRVASNDGTVIWLNGEVIWSKHEHRPSSPDSSDDAGLQLRAGWNRLVIKMAQCSPRRYLAVTLFDRPGHIMVTVTNTGAQPPTANAASQA